MTDAESSTNTVYIFFVHAALQRFKENHDGVWKAALAFSGSAKYLFRKVIFYWAAVKTLTRQYIIFDSLSNKQAQNLKYSII